MDLATDTRKKSLVVTPSGAVDHESAPAFETQLQAIMKKAADKSAAVIIDMAKLEYMSTVGLRVLMRVAKRAREMSVDIRVANLTECMREIFQISRFDKVIPVFDTIDAAEID